MKTLTLTQPWASLVAIGAKTVETRSWRTEYRGPIAIHAAKGFPREARDTCEYMPFVQELERPGIYSGSSALPRGAVVATAELVDVVSTERIYADISRGRWSRHVKGGMVMISDLEFDFGDFSEEPMRYAWLLANVVRLGVPIPAKGMLGLWEWSA